MSDITNEIKAKVFAQYLGHRILPNPKYQVPEYYKQYFDDPNRPGTYECKGSLITTGACRDLLILRPLSAITDEDAIEVFKLMGIEITKKTRVERTNECFNWIADNYKKDGRYVYPIDNQITFNGNGDLEWHNGVAYDGGEYSELKLCCYQYLQSKGYDLPQYLLGGKTLKEAGLAIYE